MKLNSKNSFKRMGVINITPNSFSDGNLFNTLEGFKQKLLSFGDVDAIDVGAESTAPMNSPISWAVEWERFQVVLPLLKEYRGILSIDTYHPETIFEFVKLKRDGELKAELIWNDVSGKFDDSVRDFLKTDPSFKYVFCHNLAPTRERSIEHMQFISNSQENTFLQELRDYFAPHIDLRVILDPCLGFSKTYDQNWYLLNEFLSLQSLAPNSEWLLGFSRKSFLRKKIEADFKTDSDILNLDQYHLKILKNLKIIPNTTTWIRTHRPELIKMP